MNNKTIITAAPDLDRVALVLASMSPDMVADIVRLVNLQGASLQSTLFAPNSIAGSQVANKFLGICSKEYIADEDFASVWAGLSTVFMSGLRNPELGNDNYQKVLENTYSLPPEIAEPIAKKIETYDILGPQSKEGQDADSWLNKVGRKLYEGFRKSANWAAGVLGTDWEIDQAQNWDVDFLYEMKNLGEAVHDLNSRARLMRAQAMISASMGVMLTGDPSDDGEDEAFLIGDTIAPFMKRTLPANIMGNSFPVVKMGLTAAGDKASRVFDAAGVKVNSGGTVTTNVEGGQNSHLTNALKGIANMSPTKMGLIGAGIGITPTIFRAMKSLLGAQGDPGDGLYAVRDVYGDAVANDVASGNMDSLARLIISDATNDFSTGDPELDDAAVGEMIMELGDAGLMAELETGGPFSRLRANMSKRRAARRRRQGTRQSEKGKRVALRQTRSTLKARNRYDQVAQEGRDINEEYPEDNYQEPEYEDQYEGYEDDYSDEGME
jgi:hypothetical protein